jgi:hypothetical protein
MTIEVRQLLIKSQVRAEPPAPARAPGSREIEQVRQQLLAECKAWLLERLQSQKER